MALPSLCWAVLVCTVDRQGTAIDHTGASGARQGV
jgi:hypothetical protein